MGTVPYTPYYTDAPKGWECPRCATIYAPSITACFCQMGRGAVFPDPKDGIIPLSQTE